MRVIRDLAAGAVDIVIGTHRLLQDDIAFKDLGLVVIDEEQRFGVMHKEKFKMLRQLVDVLTLSATPIPRTLYLALMGARDMSTIETPPHDRLPVETIVTAYDERVIRDAIQRELNRGGQVFFLHNRVKTIETMAHKLRDARAASPHRRRPWPDAQRRSGGGHDPVRQRRGRCPALHHHHRERPRYSQRQHDHHRPRRSLRPERSLPAARPRRPLQAPGLRLPAAAAPRADSLTDVRKRLSAIKQYSTLGSGFKIAMRDLEIRGAGNLLGSEQSGHITAVGFELYCQLLKQSVAALKGEKVKPRIDVQVRLDFLALTPAEESLKSAGRGAPSGSSSLSPASAYIPFRYIPDSRQRIEIYRKLAQATDKAGLSSLEQEMRDRFGPVPPPLQLLLQVAEVKFLAAERGITVIEVKEDKLMLTRNSDYIMEDNLFPRLIKKQASARLKEIKQMLLAMAPL